MYINLDIKKPVNPEGPIPAWVRCFGMFGFFFFLIKGIIWLAVIGLVYFGIT